MESVSVCVCVCGSAHSHFAHCIWNANVIWDTHTDTSYLLYMVAPHETNF